MQHLITKRQDLLDEKGRLNEAGYSTREIFDYERTMIKASGFRIKEWDYYYIGNERFGAALTIADNSYMGMISASVIDFEKATEHTSSKIVPFTFGKFALPPSADAGETSYQSKKIEMTFRTDEKQRHIRCHYHDFIEKRPLIIDVKLTEFPADRMCIATPFPRDSQAFYYNQKINLMHAKGYVQLGDTAYELGPSPLDMGLLDWGRGVWTYKNTWYWSSLNTVLADGRKFGFNLGYGFGDTTAATENMMFVDGVADKLDDVKFYIPKDDQGGYDYTSTWSVRSADGRLDLTFRPILNRKSDTNLGLLRSDQNQVFGKFYGVAILKSGEKVAIDGAVGFAERVFNKW